MPLEKTKFLLLFALIAFLLLTSLAALQQLQETEYLENGSVFFIILLLYTIIYRVKCIHQIKISSNFIESSLEFLDHERKATAI